MTLSAATTSTTIYATAPGGQAGYNNIRSLIQDVLGTASTGYGYLSIPSSAVGTDQLIAASDWINFTDSLSRIYRHQNTSSYSFTNLPTSGNIITTNFVNQCVVLINDATGAKRYARPPDPTQRSTYDSASEWTESLPTRPDWGAGIEHEITLTWSSTDSARYFFNLGGRLSAALSYAPGPYTPADLEWVNWIDATAEDVEDFIYTRSDYVSGGVKAVSYPDPDTGDTITITYTKVSNSVIKMSVLLNPTLTTTLEVTNTFTYEYSVGAINAPQPVVTLDQALGDSYTPIVVPTKILSVSTPSAYSWVTGATSAAQTISITNNGNSMATVSSITFSNAAGVTEVTNFAGLGGTTNFTLNPSQTKTFTLAYTGSTVGGPYASSFTVNSNNDAGPITVLTNQTINNTPFSITVTPSSVSATLDGPTVWRQDFIITSVNGDAFTYSATLTSPSSPSGAVGWSISTTEPAGPSVSFSPIGSTVPSYSASVTLQITANSVVSGSDTETISLSINGTISTSYSLGTWLSPQAPNNSVIGMSYDIIGGERYLTIGIGMGADGSVPLSVGGAGSIDLANLGINADNNFKAGQPQYAVTQQGDSWNSFLRNYGVWPNTIPGEPSGNVNVGITPSYFIQITASGSYNYQYSSDDDTNFYFVPVDQYGIWDGVTNPISLPNQLMTGGARTNWQFRYSGSVNLDAGYYLIRWYQNNSQGGPAAAAFQLINSSTGDIVWNTRYPVRNGPVYLYWQDVLRFRIPADGTQRTIYDFYKYVKNSYQVQGKYHWGHYFNGGLFRVIDDGAGNLNISFFGTPYFFPANEVDFYNVRETLRSLPLSFYYYIPYEVLPRYTNLDAGPTGDGTQTRFFTGFDRNGTVITVLSSIPTVAPYPPTGGGGGGGGFNDEPPEFSPDGGNTFIP